MKIQWRFRLCLFWVKSISGNAFLYLWVFGCARKMHFPEMLFRRPVNGCKLISIFILPSNSHFLENTERAEWEGDAPARRERERERKKREGTIGSPFDSESIRLRRKDFTVRLRLCADRDRNRSTNSSSPIANPDSSHPKTDRPPSLPSSLNLIGLWFFFLGFICVSVWFWFLLLWWCDGVVSVVVAFDCRSLLPWVELPCEKFVGK